MKFSIIVPVYNVEKYIRKCIDSILKQTYKNFEVIIVNDGSTDKSMDIVNEYTDKRLKIINQENKGLSAARNRGAGLASGDYIVFIDSDDYIEPQLLNMIQKSTINSAEIIRFQARMVDEYSKVLVDMPEKSFEGLNGIDAFSIISSFKLVENAWCYVFKKDYYIKNNYCFKEGTYHEDFGLIPLVIINAVCVNSINYIGYNYVQRKGSIMNDNNYKKEVKKAFDVLGHYKFLVENGQNKSDIYNSFIANSTILKARNLKGKEYNEYKKQLKTLGVYDNILSKTFIQKVKKILYKTILSLALKVIK